MKEGEGGGGGGGRVDRVRTRTVFKNLSDCSDATDNDGTLELHQPLNYNRSVI